MNDGYHIAYANHGNILYKKILSIIYLILKLETILIE